MIIDKIENAKLYKGLNERIKVALDYIEQTDFSKLKLGKHKIDEENIYAMLFEYVTKSANESHLEAHKNYIDVQYVYEGIEQVGLATLKDQQAVKKYDPKEDYSLFDETFSMVSLKKGMFAIFFPDDLHMPGISIGQYSEVKKVVVKVKV